MEQSIFGIQPNETEELIAFLNEAFTGDSRSGHFETNMPRMCGSPDSLCQHYAIRRENGKIQAALAVFRYETVIAGETFRFATVGNVATAREARGGGCMKRLMTAAMQILEDEGIDASRLGGLRSRYERYGYEPCGITHRFLLTGRNMEEYLLQNAAPSYRFAPLSAEDTDALVRVRALYEQNAVHIHRGNMKNFHDSLRMWQSIPYLVTREDGTFVGYFCADSAGNITEYGAEFPELLPGMFCRIGLDMGRDFWITVYPWSVSLCRMLDRFAEHYQIETPSNFKILHWDKILGALLRLKQDLEPLPTGTLTAEITDFGTVRLTVSAEGCFCTKESADMRADIHLDSLSAARFFFGPMSPHLVYDINKINEETALLCRAWFPLPLSWNRADSL